MRSSLRYRISAAALGCLLVLCACRGPAISPSPPCCPDAAPSRPTILSHDLTLTLTPERHRLVARDRMRLSIPLNSPEGLTFSLHPALTVQEIVRTDGRPISVAFRAETRVEPETKESVQWISLPAMSDGESSLTLEWRYEGSIEDPPKEPRHLRFVTPSETSGHIGPEGVYLSGETRWYPDVSGSLATFHAQVLTPIGWEAVTHGRQTARREEHGGAVAEWEVTARTEALTLVANRFVTARRDWKGIELATYLFPEDAGLAQEYLDASARYLEGYTKLLGPYPFPKFAVVENFFASGLGMPSFTLLGSGVIKRHYTQPYALGHEIVHSWIGNSLFNDPAQGNWVEGLTTYLANYYYEELTGTPAQAREQRRLMLLGYAVYVRPTDDYPVGQFRRKVDQKDNAIGYQKAAMVFHMLRREIGEEPFWTGLRRLVAAYQGRYANWKDVEQVFARTAGKDLRGFFAQWIEHSGAPTVRIAGAGRVATAGGGSRAWITLAQAPPPFSMQVPVTLKEEDGTSRSLRLPIDTVQQTHEIELSTRAQRVIVDPEVELFRRIPRAEIPPMLNLYVTDETRAVVLPSGGAEESTRGANELAKHIAGRSVGTAVVTDRDPLTAHGSVLVLGGPEENQAARSVLDGCKPHLNVEPSRFTVGGTSYDGAGMALLVSCPRPGAPGSVGTVFYGLSPAAVSRVARLLFFYGWQSYVVFRDGVVVARGDFPVSQEGMEVSLDEQR